MFNKLFNFRANKSEPISVKPDKISYTTIKDGEDPYLDTPITPEIIKNAVRMMKEGELLDILALYDLIIDNNDNLASCLDIRTEALKSVKFTVDSDLPDAQKEYFDDILKKFGSDLCEMTIDMKTMGIAFRQMKFEQDGNLWLPSEFTTYKNIDLRLENKKLVLYDSSGKKSLDNLQFAVFTKNRSIFQSLLKYYSIKYFVLTKWVQMTERYGQPMRVGKYRNGAPDKERNQLWNMLTQMGSKLAAMVPEGTVIDFQDYADKKGSADIYKIAMDYCEEKETKRVLGQTLTTTAEKSGTYAQAKVHDLVRKDILKGDIRDAEHVISNILTKLNRLNFNGEVIQVEGKIDEPLNRTQEVDIDVKLNGIGVQPPVEYYIEKYNLPEDTVLEKKNSIIPNSSPELRQITNLIANRNNPQTTGDKQLDQAVRNYKTQVLKSDSPEDLKFPFEIEKAFANALLRKIKTGYLKGKNNTRANAGNHSVSYDIYDIQALHAFRAEAFQVAGVHSQNILKDLKESASKAISEGATFHDWRKDAQIKGFELQNPYYARTNFNTAVNNAYLAGQWINIEKQQDIFPYLEYNSAMMETTRQSHADLHGTILPVNHPFWNTHYPINDWNCHCWVSQLTRKEAEEHQNFGKAVPDIEIPDDFKRNSGKDLCLWGKWIERQNIQPKTWQDHGLKPAKELSQSSKTKAPELLKLPDEKAYKDYYNEHLKGIHEDVTGHPVELGDYFIDHIRDKDTKARTERFEKFSRLLPTIKNADEVWLGRNSANKDIVYYIKYFDNAKPGFSVVLVEKGSLTTFYQAKENYIDKQRKGILIHE